MYKLTVIDFIRFVNNDGSIFRIGSTIGDTITLQLSGNAMPTVLAEVASAFIYKN